MLDKVRNVFGGEIESNTKTFNYVLTLESSYKVELWSVLVNEVRDLKKRKLFISVCEDLGIEVGTVKTTTVDSYYLAGLFDGNGSTVWNKDNTMEIIVSKSTKIDVENFKIWNVGNFELFKTRNDSVECVLRITYNKVVNY